MSLLALPMAVINMGTEMLYILELRLHAQNIAPDRAKRVLMDVIRANFDPRFIDELLVPQSMYSASSIRGVFERLAHSSIMRLSQSSMDKLYDLMTMGFKYQLLSMRHPSDLMCMTMNHIAAVRQMVAHSDSVSKQISLIEGEIKKVFLKLDTGDIGLLHAALLRFVQDRRVKVSLFLQDQLQLSDGCIVLDHSGPVPAGAEIPGTIRYFADTPIAEMGSLPTPYRTKPFGSLINATVGPPPPCKLGENIYAKERKKPDDAKGKDATSGSGKDRQGGDGDGSNDGGGSGSGAGEGSGQGQGQGLGVGTGALAPNAKSNEPNVGLTGLSLLAGIVGPGRGGEGAADLDGFQVDLFDGSGFFAQQLDGYEASGDAGAEADNANAMADMAEENGDVWEHVRPTHDNTVNDLLDGFGGAAASGGDGDDGDGQDLLDLMDQL